MYSYASSTLIEVQFQTGVTRDVNCVSVLCLSCCDDVDDVNFSWKYDILYCRGDRFNLIFSFLRDFSHLAEEASYGKVVTTISNVVLFTLSNVPLISLLNFASRLFAAVERGGGHPLFISQGSASSAITFAVTEKESEGVLAAVVDAFRHDTDDYGSRLKLGLDSNCSVLSVVGRGQSGFVGAVGKTFQFNF